MSQPAPRGVSTLCSLSLALMAALIVPQVHAESVHAFSAGAWITYQYLPGDRENARAAGEFTDEAFILYADGDSGDSGRWLYSVEARFGPGSFTDPDNNSTGNETTVHKAWTGWRLDDGHVLRVGKSQVPFGWKTTNFWPGDILLAGFGDQMDVGLKLTGQQPLWQYDFAYYLSDDWSSTSTDTVDDNGHWGSTNTFRKTDTWVGNLRWFAAENHSLGMSVQSGDLEDLTSIQGSRPDGEHEALAFYYLGSFNQLSIKASYISQSRNLPRAYQQSAFLPAKVENERYAVEVGYGVGAWSFYLDASAAEPGSRGNDADRVTAIAPGVSYDYGPGWIYLEYLWQDGYVDRNGQVGEGDFDAIYLSFDFYL